MYLYPKPRKKTVMPVDYKAKILNAAVRVFASKGYAKTTMSDVAIQAKVGIGTLYNYFKNKDDLLISCIKKTIDDEIKQVQDRSSKEEDHMEQLFSFFMHHATLVERKPYIARFLVVELRQSESFYQRNPSFNPINYYLDYVREIFSDAISTGRIKAFNVDALAYLVVGAMDMVLSQWLISKETLDIQPLITSIRQIIREGVSTKH
ncbi:MAG: TetR/AcrR family transcriptional regulator [Candidatus Cloacimonetes bacterium]|nr:TetR/AcrR family transcriptional regulator [Candidatus Cloacimonadota bacterium]